ncbi:MULTISPECIES: flagellar basal-body MS-ring/collar protein FliF [unclassified Sulfitobacter]|mgnify:CR=1 FL=1|uniref:flagellar basal-body MS-ring/collar protein FliF n=1 Tax=unclassified Sulfitobacter TaxID=196795 RepID=UPI001592B47C|nr:flagellar basal-body MS-ring/collar protein FliF [Sulfitobacter sp. HGT1]
MQQIVDIWIKLTFRRRISILIATVLMFFGILLMSRIVTSPNMALLYSGLDSSAAGDVVRTIEQQGVAFEVRGGAIFVDSTVRDELRLTLASEGLPANGSRGYELLDSLTGFGTTSQMFDAAYWRAKEGELARTIVASPQISLARVHIGGTGSNPFQRSVTPKASVSLTPRAGEISTSQAKAVRYLVSSAVAGLSPEDVAVIDSNGSLIGSGDDPEPGIQGDDKAAMLKDKVERLLEARVGRGNAIVEVSVETVTESESVRERRFDPDGRVAISTDTEERSNSSSDAGNGAVTVASNLPDKNASEGGGRSSLSNSETRERVNYEVSETEREIIRIPGAVKRLTVAVLVNQETTTDANGESTSQTRGDAEIEILRELVSSAVGYDEGRGDVITIKSMALKSVPPVGTQVSSSLIDRLNLDLVSAIQMVVLGLVTVILGLFVVRPLLLKPVLPIRSEVTPPLLSQEVEVGIPDDTGPQFPNDFSQAPPMFEIPGLADQTGTSPGIGLGQLSNFSQSDSPVERLRSMIGDKQEETIEILRTWLEEKEENAQ